MSESTASTITTRPTATDHRALCRDLVDEIDASSIDGVRDAAVSTAKYPERVEIELDVASIPEYVRGWLDARNARITDAVVRADGGLTIEVLPRESLKPAGQRNVRTHGNSVVVTLTREALDLSGFDEGDKVDINAREGEVRFTHHPAE